MGLHIVLLWDFLSPPLTKGFLSSDNKDWTSYTRHLCVSLKCEKLWMGVLQDPDLDVASRYTKFLAIGAFVSLGMLSSFCWVVVYAWGMLPTQHLPWSFLIMSNKIKLVCADAIEAKNASPLTQHTLLISYHYLPLGGKVRSSHAKKTTMLLYYSFAWDIWTKQIKVFPHQFTLTFPLGFHRNTYCTNTSSKKYLLSYGSRMESLLGIILRQLFH